MFAQVSLRGAELWFVAGWTMLHFLWLGTLVGLSAMTCRLLLRRASADVRYIVALMSLTVLAALPVGIGAWLIAGSQIEQAAIAELPHEGEIIELNERAVVATGASAPGSAGGFVADEAAVSLRATTLVEPTNPRQTSAGSVERSRGLTDVLAVLDASVPHLPWLWLIGTPLTFALLVTGVIGAERLRRGSRLIEDGPIAEACARLRQSLGVTRRVAVAICERIAAPVLVGILRPIILLPPSALTGWSPDEIEMVLLHELSHVRRWDNLVNLVQRLIESLLFFHPAVWLVSGWVRREREACCDAVVVARTHRPHAYAEMLVALAAQMPRSVLFHPAATSAMATAPLRSRIRRILQLEDDPMLVNGKSFALVLGGLIVAALLAVLYLPSMGQAEESAAATAATEAAEITEVTGDADASEDSVKSADDDVEITVDELRLESPEGETVINSDGDRVKLRSEQNRPDTDGKQVIATFSTNADDMNRLFDAVKEARAKKQSVDVVFRGDVVDLVVVPPPSEADWPKMLGDPPRKERIIADMAFERLGLKLVPASQLEVLERDVRGSGGSGVKILGGNVPQGLPLPAFLQRIENQDLGSFDALYKWLLRGERPTRPVKLYAFADGHEYLFDAQTTKKTDAAVPATSEKSTTDDWLAGVAFASPEDAEISRRAWKELHLKIVPAAEAELQEVRKGGLRVGLKLHDFEGIPNLEGPFILMAIQTKGSARGIIGFRDLEKVLDEIASLPADEIIVLNGFAKNRSVFQYSLRRPKASAEAKSAPKALFPSLEDQKLADLAWKQLQLELEPISDDELRHVQGRGYDGGVRVSALGNASFAQNYIQAGDILVGLHVWPTKHMADVAAVLERDDLAELNPLKFYVLRPAHGKDDNGPTGMVLHPASGRISVQSGGGGRSTSQVDKPGRDSRPIDNLVDAELARDLQYASLRERLMMSQYRLAQLHKGAKGEKSREVVQLERQIAGLQQQLAQYRESIKQKIIEQRGGTSGQNPQNNPEDIDRPYLDTLELRTEAATSSAPQGQDSANQTSLRYDGKSFDEWRTIWRNELSNERRLEAIRALAAFAKVGYGHEAAEAILDVAGEYDFRTPLDSDSPEAKLRTQIINSLVSGPGFDPTAAFNSIAKRYDASPDKRHGLLVRFLSRGPQLDASVVDQVRQLLKHHKSGDMRAGALAAVVASDPTTMSATIKAALADSDPQVISKAMQIISGQEQLRQANEGGAKNELAPFAFPVDEFVQLLLRTPARRDRDGNWTAYSVLSRLSTDTAGQLTDQLVQILKDPARKTDHLAAIRAVGFMRKQATAARPELERFLNDDSADTHIRVAAATALDAFDGRFGQHGRRLIPRQRKFQEVDGKELTRRQQEQQEHEEIERLLIEEQNLLLNR